MLHEKQRAPSNRPVSVGETVKIKTTGQVGTVEGFENGQWVVNVEGAKVLVFESQIQVREMLYG